MKTTLFASLLATVGLANGAITYVDPTDIVIPSTFGGVYLDLETPAESGSTGSGSAGTDSYTISYTEPASGDWDVNFFFGGAFIAHNTSFQPYRSDPNDNLSAIDNLGINTLIDGAAVSPEPSSGASAPLTTPDFGGSGTTTGGDINGNQSPTHMGSGTDQFASGSGTTGYIGFVLNPGAGELYGWIRVTLADDGSTGLIHEWAYSDTPIEIGQIPEPRALLLMAFGALCVVRRRRRA
ncbi:hypothetical protein HAHE_06490 [Haloferula helveola]|uniref:Ice-binding protein C-terminal domain-containing protein n=1 Tax=Haloferula helveola TaxID=490095 RepID=A0ABM7RBI3_9BACT|nr:hypothetical protein HAHE_06490 [Haloferula helveola]